MVLASCQDLAGGPARTDTVAAAQPYPSLHTVPPRPQLSYPVEQRRAIVDRLIADRENARYTSAVIRYRTGLSSMPPPEPETLPDTLAAVPPEVDPEARGTPSAPSAAPSERPVADETTGPIYQDDDLDSFMQDMLDDQVDEPPGEAPEARAAPRRGAAVPPGAGQPAA
ncbi:MAG: hypothetical protein ACREJ5_30200, partial [Geminicoccaceae bacterium]